MGGKIILLMEVLLEVKQPLKINVLLPLRQAEDILLRMVFGMPIMTLIMIPVLGAIVIFQNLSAQILLGKIER